MAIQKTILVVEDDPDLSRVIALSLEGHNYQVQVASNGEIALDFIKKQCPDLVLLDLLMPVMDGFELLKFIRKNPCTQNVPVIILTNYDQSASAPNLVGLPVQEYILKTDIHVHKIDDVVAKYLR